MIPAQPQICKVAVPAVDSPGQEGRFEEIGEELFDFEVSLKLIQHKRQDGLKEAGQLGLNLVNLGRFAVPLITLNPYKDYPTDWRKYQGNHTKYLLPPELPRPTETYRFGARYRAAKSYKGSKFDGYTSRDTAKGYSALVAMMLAFSAFEYFHKQALNLNVPDFLKQLNSDHPTEMTNFQDDLETLAKDADIDKLFRAIHPHLDGRHQKSIDDLLSGKDVNLIRAFAAVRHAFIHGHLTPNMKEVDPTTVIELCRLGYRFMMTMMDIQFSARLNWTMPPPYAP